MRGERVSGRPVDPERSRIVLVGAPAYSDPSLPDVPVVANNVADLAAVLTDPDLGGFSRAHCAIAPARAREAVIGELLVQAASEAEDLLLFYYSGHGLLSFRRQELYLSLADTRPDHLAFTALPFDAIRDACLDSRAQSRVVILDSCFSGRAIGETLTDDAVAGQLEIAGTYTLASTSANRTALVLPGERHTAFTERLIRLLQTGSPAAGQMISLGDIYRLLHAQLKSEGLPVPQQRGTATADLLGLVRNRRFFSSAEVVPSRLRRTGLPETTQRLGDAVDQKFRDYIEERVREGEAARIINSAPSGMASRPSSAYGAVKRDPKRARTAGVTSESETRPTRFGARTVSDKIASVARIGGISVLSFLALLCGLISVTGVVQISIGKEDSSIGAAYGALIFILGMTLLWSILLVRFIRHRTIIPARVRNLMNGRASRR